MKVKDRNKSVTIIEAFAIMLVLQGVLQFLKLLISPMIPNSRFVTQVLTMALMIPLTVAVIVYAKLRKQELFLFPKRFSKLYVAATVVTALLYITAPSNYTQGVSSVIAILYGSIVTPIYEELLFRGYIWNRFEKVFDKKAYVYIWNIVLFTLWHL